MIRDILERLWTDCNNVPDDDTIYDPIGVLQDQAEAQIEEIIAQRVDAVKTDILKTVEKDYIEKTKLIKNLPREIYGSGFDMKSYNQGWNEYRSQAIEIIEKA